MRPVKKTYVRLLFMALLSLCVLLGFVSGCSIFGNKEKAEFKPGNEWIEDMRARVADTIEDPGKKTRMLALLDQIEKELFEVDRIIVKLYVDLDTLGDNYNSTPEAFQEIISEFEADRKIIVGRIIDTRFQMRDLSTPEQWNDLTDVKKSKGIYIQTIRQPGQ